VREALLDTDMLSEVIKGRDASVRDRARAYLTRYRQLTTSSLTLLEIAYGFARKGRSTELEAYLLHLAHVRVLSFESDEGELAGRILGELERTGRSIGQLDPMIAAIAITRQLVLVTGNGSDYQHVINAGYRLDLENWRDASAP
jgi:tRNA(fMet)-specific endonuclease VapC